MTPTPRAKRVPADLCLILELTTVCAAGTKLNTFVMGYVRDMLPMWRLQIQ